MSTWKIVFNLEWTILKRDRSAMSVLLLFAAFLKFMMFWMFANAQGTPTFEEQICAMQCRLHFQ